MLPPGLLIPGSVVPKIQYLRLKGDRTFSIERILIHYFCSLQLEVMAYSCVQKSIESIVSMQGPIGCAAKFGD